MADIAFRDPHATDVVQLALHMRRADVEELTAAGFTDLHAVVADGVKRSVWCKAAVIDGEVACIFGVAPIDGLLGERGAPWLLATPVMLRHRAALMRLAPGYIAAMLKTYPQLLNVVHAKNTKAVAWLKRMGFVLADAETYGPHGEPFHFFRMGAS